MQRVKLFWDRNLAALEQQINDWIQSENVRVINVSISEDENGRTAAILVES
jgi:hypothetical protein